MKRKKPPTPVDPQFTRALATVRNARGGLYKGFQKLRLQSEPDLLRKASATFAKHPAYKPFTSKVPFPTKVADLAGTGFRYFADFTRELAWLSGLLSAYAESLSAFVTLRDDFEHQYLLGEYAEASITLDKVAEKCGFSVWLTQRRMDLGAQTSGSSSRSRILTESLGEGGPGFIHYLMAWFMYRSAATVSRTEYERFLREASSSRTSSNLLLYADAGIYIDIDPEQASAMLSSSDVMPIVDRYQFALVTTAMLLASEGSGRVEADAIDRHLCSLATRIKDPLLERLGFRAGNLERFPAQDARLLALTDAYSLGNYHEIARDFRAQDYRACLIEALSLAVRSLVSSEEHTVPLDRWGIDPKSVLGRVAVDLHEVLRFGSGGIDAKLRLNKLILVHATQRWASSLSSILERQLHDERVWPPNRDQQVAALCSSANHPIVAFSLNDQNLERAYLNAASSAHPDSITVAALAAVSTRDHEVVPIEIPRDRAGHLGSLALLRRGNYEAASDVLEALAGDTSSALLRREASLLLVASHLRSGNSASAANLAANLFVEERYFGLVLPIGDLVRHLMLEHDLPLATSKTRGQISVAIVFDIYSRFIAADRDAERADAFNDVLRRYGVSRASELPSVVPVELRPQLTYFLRYICIPEVLDQSLVLDNTQSVEDERMDVLLALTEMPDPAGVPIDAYKEEIREIRTRQIVRETALKLDQSKIYVNVDGIRRALDVEMRENWNRYKFMVSSGDDTEFADAEKLFISSGDGNQNVVMVRVKRSKSERFSLFKRIVSEVRDQFTLNREHGLNSNLSANIRHGYVLRELRAPLVNQFLVTNLISDERGYHPNLYWSDRLHTGSDLEDDILETFHREMSDFSERVDRAIERLNRHLLRIRSDANPQGLFDYTLAESALSVLDARWGDIDSYDDFMDAIFDAMWIATEHNLRNVRNELRGSILSHFIDAIDDLGNKLASLGVTHSVPTIVDAMTMAKTDMRAALERVASWFTLSGHHEYADFDLEIPLRAGLETVKATDADLAISHTYQATPSAIMLMGWSLPGFGRLFFQLLDNAAKHGGRGRDELNISVSAELEGGALLIRVENDLPDDADLDALNARVRDLNLEYGQAKAMDLIGEEGGSGYSKIWKLIHSDLRREHDISVSLEEDKFVVVILMNAGGIVCRPS